MIDVVDLADAVFQQDQVSDDLEDVLAAERPLVERHVELEFELVVELQASNPREVVPLRVEEEVVEEGRGRLGRRRIAGT